MANNLKELRNRAGLSQDALATAMGTSRNQLAKLESGSRRLTEDWIRRAADALGVPNTAIIADDLTPPQEPPAPPDASFPVPVEFPRRMLPVYGQAAGGMSDEGRFVLNGRKIADVLCPPALEHVRDAYAIYMHGESMLPAFRPGDTLYIDPGQPVVTGDEVVVQIRDGHGQPPLGYVKEFIARRGGKLLLKQHNPPPGQDNFLDFPLDRVVTVHKVIGAIRR